MHQFHKFILSRNPTCFGQFVCPSSGVYSLYTQQRYMSYRFVDSFRAGPGLSILIMDDELSETCRVSWQKKFLKLVHLVGFIIKKHKINQVTKQASQCTYNVTLRRVRATVVVAEKQWVLHNLSVCICSLRYPACNVHETYCHIFSHFLINGRIFEKKSDWI